MAIFDDRRKFNGTYIDFLTNDRFYGTEENDTVYIHGGNDFFNDIAGGNDTVHDVRLGGSSGNDVVSTGIGNDVVYSNLDF